MRGTKITYLVPDLFGPPGGIARYCRNVCRALVATDATLSVLALHDQHSNGRNAHTSFQRMIYHACHSSRKEFLRNSFITTLMTRPSIILVGHVNFAPLGWILARMVGARMAVFIYGIDVWEPLPFARKWALRRADSIISISRFTALQAIKVNQISLSKVNILHNCLDPQFEQPMVHQEVTSTLSMLIVGRMSLAEQYKGHDNVIKAMPILLKRFPQLVCHIVGDGDGRAGLETLAGELGVSYAILFHGIVSDDELAQHYADVSLFIMPSRKEGFGFVFLEAMATGIPAIGGNLDATSEVVVDGETGYIIDPTSVDAIVEVTSRLLADQKLRARMGQAAKIHAHENFGFSAFTDRLKSYLSEIITIPHDSRTPNSL